MFYKTREPLPRARVLPNEAHPNPVTQLWAVGRVRTVPAARDLPDANCAEESRFCATCAKEVLRQYGLESLKTGPRHPGRTAVTPEEGTEPSKTWDSQQHRVVAMDRERAA